ncbi:MAG: amidohydrolase family protein [Ilumatobacteraceae bacterium]
MLLRRALLADGTTADVGIEGDSIVSVGATDPHAEAPADSIDLDGWLLLPAFTEPHAHLDKAFLAEVVPNPTGDLLGAIMAMEESRHLITVADTIERAERAARLMLANGVTAIRTHADLTTTNGMCSVEALIEVRKRLRGLVDIQVCALAGWPSIGPEGADQRALLRDAIEAGVDLIGGCPHLETDAAAANDLFLTMAGEAGLPVDLHTDETLDPSTIGLDDLAGRVIDTGFSHGVTASHCVSLGMQPEYRQREIADKVADAGLSVVALPHTNLYLQGREHQSKMPRSLTAVRALRNAGVPVAAGADNLQDPFNPVGRADPLETAGLMIMTSHLLPDDALASVSSIARVALGLAPGSIEPGARADLVALPAGSVREAIAMGPQPRFVISGGRIARDPRPARQTDDPTK